MMMNTRAVMIICVGMFCAGIVGGAEKPFWNSVKNDYRELEAMVSEIHHAG